MKKKIALITGITGQDGALLAEFLLKKNYIVHGIKRRSSSFNSGRIDHLYKDPRKNKVNFFIHYGDLTDTGNLIRIIKETAPDEIYNLGAMSHVHVSFESPEYTANVDGLGVLRLLEAIRILGLEGKTKLLQASTSEMFGNASSEFQDESTPFYPRSPYAVAKVFGYWSVINHREAYGVHASNGIFFNHESPIRGETFVTKKIVRAIKEIVHGRTPYMLLGNLYAIRDWGHAKDYVRAMWMMLQNKEPLDLIIASGKAVSVKDFAIAAFIFLGIEIAFRGAGEEEVGFIKSIKKERFENILPKQLLANVEEGQIIIKIDPVYFRPTEVEFLLGDSSKARKLLGWKPEYDFEDLVADMVLSEFTIINGDS